MTRDIHTERRAIRMVLEEPELFEITDKNGDKFTLTLYPLQLGKLMMISDRLLDLDLIFDDDEQDAVQRMWKVCSERAREVAEIVAIASLRTKEELEQQLNERTELLLWSPTMTPTAYANILYHIVAQNYHADFMSAIRSVRMLRVTIENETKAGRIASTEDAPSSER